MGKPLNSSTLEREFERHLKQSGKARNTIRAYCREVRRFLEYVGDVRLDRVGEETVKAFFKETASGNGKSTYRTNAMVIGQFLRFAAARMPAPAVGTRGSAVAPVPAVKDSREIALRQTWAVDRLVEQKEAGEDLMAKFGRKLIDHYLYFESRLKGGPESVDELTRLAEECRELIQSNLPLLLSLSAQGRSVHSILDNRMQQNAEGNKK